MGERHALTAERLRAVLKYCPETGRFTRRSNGKAAGFSSAGNSRYSKISIDNRQYLAHRLAWLYVHLEWPADEIDHINGDGHDNRLANLRAATPAQNRTNALAQKSSNVGLRGVHYHPGAKRYRAQICKNLKTRHIGYFDTPEAAHAAYLAAASSLHGEFVRH